MLIGYVSDEDDATLSDVLLEFADPHNREPKTARSTASGAVYADLVPGSYRVTLVKAGS